VGWSKGVFFLLFCLEFAICFNSQRFLVRSFGEANYEILVVLGNKSTYVALSRASDILRGRGAVNLK